MCRSGEEHVVELGGVIPDGKVSFQRLTGLADQGHHPILSPLALPDGQLAAHEVHILQLEVHELAYGASCSIDAGGG